MLPIIIIIIIIIITRVTVMLSIPVLNSSRGIRITPSLFLFLCHDSKVPEVFLANVVNNRYNKDEPRSRFLARGPSSQMNILACF